MIFLSSPCSNNNGGCQHLCLPSGFQSFRCKCSVGYSKLTGSGNCQINRSHPDSVLFTTNYGLEIVSRIKPMQTQIFRPISKMERPQSFEIVQNTFVIGTLEKSQLASSNGTIPIIFIRPIRTIFMTITS